jgi:hypothetical protein
MCGYTPRLNLAPRAAGQPHMYAGTSTEELENQTAHDAWGLFMSKSIRVEIPDFDYVDFVVKNGDHAVVYKLQYDYAALKQFEDVAGIDLKDVAQWKNVKSHMMPALVHAGLGRHHPEITINEVAGFLHPSTQTAVQDAVFELIFPGLIDKIREAQEKDNKRPNAEGPVEKGGASA